jgi:hypothetical protein
MKSAHQHERRPPAERRRAQAGDAEADRQRMVRNERRSNGQVFLSNLGIRLDNFGAKALKMLEHKMRMVGPGGLEPPTRRL